MSVPSAAAVRAGWVADDRFSPVIALMIWTLTVLMIVPDGFDYTSLITSSTSGPSSGSAVSRFLWLALLGTGMAIVTWRASLSWLVVRWLNPYFCMFVVLVLASVLWSINPGVTFRRFIRVITIVLDAISFAVVSWNPRRFQMLLLPVVSVILLGSIIFGLVKPGLAIHQETSHELLNSWRGLTSHKNELGALSAMGVVLWFHSGIVRDVRPILAVAGVAVSAACLLLSRSSTSLLTTVFAIIFLTAFLRSPPNLRRYMPAFIVTFIIILLIWAIAILRLVPGLDVLLTPIAAITGKDLTFTGRSEIWAIIMDHVRLNPLLGTGAGAYWVGPSPQTPSYDFIVRMHFYPGSAHSGYLDFINDFGFLGFTVLLAYMASYVSQSFQLTWIDRDRAALFIVLFLQQSISNLSESQWFNPLNVSFVIMALATVSLSRGLLDQQFRRYYGEPFANEQPASQTGALTTERTGVQALHG